MILGLHQSLRFCLNFKDMNLAMLYLLPLKYPPDQKLVSILCLQNPNLLPVGKSPHILLVLREKWV